MSHHHEESHLSQGGGAMRIRATTGQWCDGSNSSSSPPGISQEGSRMEVPHSPPPEECQPRPQLADIRGTPPPVDVGLIPQHRIRTISSPYTLQRFLTIDTESEPLRHEVNIGILEGRVCEGEDMLSRRMDEEGWEEVNVVDEGISRDLETQSEEDQNFQDGLVPQICTEATPIHLQIEVQLWDYWVYVGEDKVYGGMYDGRRYEGRMENMKSDASMKG